MTFFILNLSLDFSANLVELRIEKVLTYTIHTKPDTEKKKARTNNLYGSQETGNYDLQATEISN